MRNLYIELTFLGVILIIEAFTTGLLSTNQPLWFDELYSLALAKQPTSELFAALFKGIDSHPPLHYFIIKLSLWMSGSPRLLFSLGYIGSLVILAKLAIKLDYSPSLVVSTYCLSTCKELGWEARPYSVLLGIFTVVLFVYYSKSSFRKLALAILLTLMNYSHFFGFIITALFCIADFLYNRRSLGIKYPFVVGFLSIGALLQAFSAFSHFRQIRIVVQQPDPSEGLPSVIASRTVLALLHLVSFKGVAYITFLYACLPSMYRANRFIQGLTGLTLAASFGMNLLIKISNLRYICFFMVCFALHVGSKRVIESWKQLIVIIVIFCTLSISNFNLLTLHNTEINQSFQNAIEYNETKEIYTDLLSMPVLQLSFPNVKIIGVYDSTHPISPLLVGFFGKEYNLICVKELLAKKDWFVYMGRSAANEILELERLCTLKNRKTIVHPDDRFESLAQLPYVQNHLKCA